MKKAVLQHRKLTRTTALLTAFIFLATNHFSFSTAHAAEPAPRSTQIQPLAIDHLNLPVNFGEVVEFEKGKLDQSVIIIQDAHSIPDAQKSIANLIQYLSEKFGVEDLALEGASGDLDPQIFKSFPDQELLRKVMKGYMNAGELAGGTAATIFSKKKIKSRGVEDWNLYEDGLGLYLTALEKTPEISQKLIAQSQKLKAEKEKIYSKKFLAVDHAVENFYENQTELADLLKVLASVQSPQAGSSLESVWIEINKQNQEPGTKHQEKDIEVREIAGQVEQFLKAHSAKPREDHQNQESSKLSAVSFRLELKTFNSKKQEWMTGAISAEVFGLFLKETAEKAGLHIEMSTELLGMVHEQKKLKSIEGTKIYRELEAYIREVKEQLIQAPNDQRLTTNADQSGERSAEGSVLSASLMTRTDPSSGGDAQQRGLTPMVSEVAQVRALDQQTENLRLLNKLAKLELSREEWNKLKNQEPGTKNPESLWALGISRSDMVYHLSFYANAEERDEIFFKNLTQAPGSRFLVPGPTVIVAGGFHAEGITTRLKAAGIGYALVMPKIRNLPEHSNYQAQMRGEVSWKDYFEVENGRIHLYKAFVRATRDKLLRGGQSSGLSSVPNDTQPDLSLLKSWRDQIIRDLSDSGNIERAGFYTRFMDEVVSDTKVSDTYAGTDLLMSKVENFISGLFHLEKQNQLTAPNIANLLQKNTMPPREVAGAIAGNWASKEIVLNVAFMPEVPAVEIPVREIALPTPPHKPRSEARNIDSGFSIVANNLRRAVLGVVIVAAALYSTFNVERIRTLATIAMFSSVLIMAAFSLNDFLRRLQIQRSLAVVQSEPLKMAATELLNDLVRLDIRHQIAFEFAGEAKAIRIRLANDFTFLISGNGNIGHISLLEKEKLLFDQPGVNLASSDATLLLIRKASVAATYFLLGPHAARSEARYFGVNSILAAMMLLISSFATNLHAPEEGRRSQPARVEPAETGNNQPASAAVLTQNPVQPQSLAEIPALKLTPVEENDAQEHPVEIEGKMNPAIVGGEPMFTVSLDWSKTFPKGNVPRKGSIVTLGLSPELGKTPEPIFRVDEGYAGPIIVKFNVNLNPTGFPTWVANAIDLDDPSDIPTPSQNKTGVIQSRQTVVVVGPEGDLTIIYNFKVPVTGAYWLVVNGSAPQQVQLSGGTTQQLILKGQKGGQLPDVKLIAAEGRRSEARGGLANAAKVIIVAAVMLAGAIQQALAGVAFLGIEPIREMPGTPVLVTIATGNRSNVEWDLVRVPDLNSTNWQAEPGYTGMGPNIVTYNLVQPTSGTPLGFFRLRGETSFALAKGALLNLAGDAAVNGAVDESTPTNTVSITLKVLPTASGDRVTVKGAFQKGDLLQRSLDGKGDWEPQEAVLNLENGEFNFRSAGGPFFWRVIRPAKGAPVRSEARITPAHVAGEITKIFELKAAQKEKAIQAASIAVLALLKRYKTEKGRRNAIRELHDEIAKKIDADAIAKNSEIIDKVVLDGFMLGVKKNLGLTGVANLDGTFGFKLPRGNEPRNDNFSKATVIRVLKIILRIANDMGLEIVASDGNAMKWAQEAAVAAGVEKPEQRLETEGGAIVADDIIVTGGDVGDKVLQNIFPVPINFSGFKSTNPILVEKVLGLQMMVVLYVAMLKSGAKKSKTTLTPQDLQRQLLGLLAITGITDQVLQIDRQGNLTIMASALEELFVSMQSNQAVAIAA